MRFLKFALVALLVTGSASSLFAADAEKKKKKEKKPDIEAMFKQLDTSNDGKLTLTEFKEFKFPGKKTPKNAPTLEELFKKLDADKNDSVSLEEFKKLPEVMKGEKKKDKAK